jgi:transposase
MELHGNARTCPNSRRLLVERVREKGWSVMAAAEAAGVSERTVYRWLKRWREEGQAGLLDRSSRPRRSPHRLPAAKVEAIRRLRKLRMTAAQIAEILGLALSTVSLWLKRIGLGKARDSRRPSQPTAMSAHVQASSSTSTSSNSGASPHAERATAWSDTSAARSSLAVTTGVGWSARPDSSTSM